MSESFYIHLESAKLKGVENNTPSEFYINFTDPIVLLPKEGYKWEVALEEIVIPNALNNITQDDTVHYRVIKTDVLLADHQLPDISEYPQLTHIYDKQTATITINYTLQLGVGFYDPIKKIVQLDSKKIMFRINKGAQPTRVIRNLLKKLKINS